MYIYILKDGNNDILASTNLTHAAMTEAIKEKDMIINYSNDEKHNYMTDYEILEEIISRQGDYLNDITVSADDVFILNEKLE